MAPILQLLKLFAKEKVHDNVLPPLGAKSRLGRFLPMHCNAQPWCSREEKINKYLCPSVINHKKHGLVSQISQNFHHGRKSVSFSRKRFAKASLHTRLFIKRSDCNLKKVLQFFLDPTLQYAS